MKVRGVDKSTTEEEEAAAIGNCKNRCCVCFIM